MPWQLLSGTKAAHARLSTTFDGLQITGQTWRMTRSTKVASVEKAPYIGNNIGCLYK